MTTREYSVGGAYKTAATLFLVLSPYFYYRFFADLVYGDDGRHWESALSTLREHPFVLLILLGLPALAVFVGLVALTYRFAVDLIFPSTASGVLEGAETSKRGLMGERLLVQISGKQLALLADVDVGSLLLASDAVGRTVFVKTGGFGKVLHLRIE